MRNPSYTKKGPGRVHRDNRIYYDLILKRKIKSKARAKLSLSASQAMIMLPHLVKGYTFSTIPSKDVHTK